MEFVVTGEIKSSTFDRVVDLDRVEFTDKTKKVDVFFEFPRLEGFVSLEDVKTSGNWPPFYDSKEEEDTDI